jgi:hypothetical protein
MMLSNNKGISLIVLIVAMTLIAILGASFVSLMGSKQKGFLYQIDSYRALNITNAGVEFAIRYISDNVSDTSSTYFQNLSTSDDLGNTLFASGSFSVTRNYNNTIGNDNIEVAGLYKNSTRVVRLSNFRRYIKALTLVSDPTVPLSDRTINITSPRAAIQIANNSESNIVLNSIQVSVTFTVSGTKHLKSVYLGNTNTDLSNPIFDGGSSGMDIQEPPSINPPVSLILGDRLIPNGAPSGPNKWLIFEFDSGENPSGNYTLIFSDTSPASIIRF